MHLILDSLSIALKQKNMIDVCHEIHTLKNRLGKKTRYIIRYFKNICNNYSAD